MCQWLRVAMCVFLSSRSFGFTPVDPLLSGHWELPFNFSRPAVDTSHFGNCWVYRTFLHGYRGRKISSSEKALRGFQTGWDKDWSIYTLRGCFTLVLDGCLRRVSLQWENLLLLNCSIKNNMDESINFNFILITLLCISGAKEGNKLDGW